MAASDAYVLVGQPCSSGECATNGAVLLDPALGTLHRWTGDSDYGLPGSAVAIGSNSGDPIFAVSQISGGSSGFSYAFVLSATASDGVLHDVASLTFFGNGLESIGTDLDFAAVGPEEAVELLVIGAVGGRNLADGAIYAIDPTRTGQMTPAEADLAITGPPGLGGQFAALDLDGDGRDDLVPTGSGSLSVAFYPGPWTGRLAEADAAGVWTSDRPEFQLGDRVNGVGDVTGDGLDDVAFCACTWGDAPYREGRLYVVAGSSTDLGFGVADDLPIQIRGTFEGEGVGYGIAGGDVTGDGLQDLVVGASGVPPGSVSGAVLVFPGPVSGVSDASDAPIRVYGEYENDLFGRAMATLDADGDAQADLVVGAHGWPGGASRGGVYLLPGAALFD